MRFDEALLKRLETEQVKHACSSLATPRHHTEFDYGRSCGFYAGLEHARRILEEMISEDEMNDNDR